MKRSDVDIIISSYDFDKESKIIGDSIIYNLKLKKKVYRLPLNEWTPREILKVLQNIQSNTEIRSSTRHCYQSSVG